MFKPNYNKLCVFPLAVCRDCKFPRTTTENKFVVRERAVGVLAQYAKNAVLMFVMLL